MENGGEERVKVRAYELWEMEGRPDGKDKEHWSRAESEPQETRGAGDEERTQGSEGPVTRRKKTVRSSSGESGGEKLAETHTTTRDENG